MKLHYLLLFFSISLLLSSCIIDDPYIEPDMTEPYYGSAYEPVIVKRELLDSTTKLIQPRKIVNSGKIYIKDNLLFVGEVNEGFHIFDNTNPEAPVKKAFLKVLGASDLSIKGNNIYVNNAVDLIAMKPNQDYTKVEITKRVKDIFPQMISPDGFRYYNLKENEIIVNWQKRK